MYCDNENTTIMSQNQKHWKSKALILLGAWLWEQGEYGHALLCYHAPHWGFKIGTQLKICWGDVFDREKGKVRPYVNLQDKNVQRPIYMYTGQSIDYAYKKLGITDVNQPMYLNYKTGKPLSSSTLNRELQRFSEKFLAEIKTKTGTELDLKPLKSNAFEIAWALDMVKKHNATPAVFKLISTFMGHRTVKDTIELLEIEPNPITEVEFNLIRDIHWMADSNVFDDEEELTDYVFNNIIIEFKDGVLQE